MQSPKMMFMKSPLMAYGNDGIELKKKVLYGIKF